MSHNKMYRSFIILQEDEKGYSVAPDKQVSGYAKIEVKNGKCKIAFYAQNIDRNKGKCNIVLISSKKDMKKIINLGEMNISAQGKGEAAKEYNDTNIAGLDIGYEKVTGAAVCIMNANKINSVMYGFMNGEQPKDNWKEYEVVNKKENEKIAPNTIKGKEEEISEEIKATDEEIKKQYEEEKQLQKNIQQEEAENQALVKEEANIEKMEEAKRSDSIDCITQEQIKEYERVRAEVEEKKRKVKEEKEKLDKMLKEMAEVETKISSIEGIDGITVIDLKRDINELEESEVQDEVIENEVSEEEVSEEDRDSEEVEIDELDERHHKYKKCKKYDKCSKPDDKCFKPDDKCPKLDDDYHKHDKCHKEDEKCHKHDECGKNKIFIDEVEIGLKCECEDHKKKKEHPHKKKDGCCREDDDNNLIEEVGDIEAEVENKFDKYEEEIEYRNVEESFEIRGSVGEFFELLAEDLEEVRGKHKEIKYCKWYKVPVLNLDEMCNSSNYNKYTVIYYPMINYYPYIRKYGHFVLGYKCDRNGKMKYIIYGIPGKKDKSEQPYCGKTGFVSWIRDDEMGPDMGYWLMFYDFKNSVIVVPME